MEGEGDAAANRIFASPMWDGEPLWAILPLHSWTFAATIRNRLARLEEYPNGETFDWINITPEEPEWVGEQGGHIYAVTADALLYF